MDKKRKKKARKNHRNRDIAKEVKSINIALADLKKEVGKRKITFGDIYSIFASTLSVLGWYIGSGGDIVTAPKAPDPAEKAISKEDGVPVTRLSDNEWVKENYPYNVHSLMSFPITDFPESIDEEELIKLFDELERASNILDFDREVFDSSILNECKIQSDIIKLDVSSKVMKIYPAMSMALCYAIGINGINPIKRKEWLAYKPIKPVKPGNNGKY